MKIKNQMYSSLISSDWSECLSPSGPFDVISFTYPYLEQEVKKIFSAYTGNLIPLSEANRRIEALCLSLSLKPRWTLTLMNAFQPIVVWLILSNGAKVKASFS
jgi:hypothetical protein